MISAMNTVSFGLALLLLANQAGQVAGIFPLLMAPWIAGGLAGYYSTNDHPYCTTKHPNGALKWDGAAVTVHAPKGWTTDKVVLSVWDNEDLFMSEESCTEPITLTQTSDKAETVWTYGAFTTSCSDSGQLINSGEVELYEKIESYFKNAEGKECKVTFNQCLPERKEGDNYIGGVFDYSDKTPC